MTCTDATLSSWKNQSNFIPVQGRVDNTSKKQNKYITFSKKPYTPSSSNSSLNHNCPGKIHAHMDYLGKFWGEDFFRSIILDYTSSDCIVLWGSWDRMTTKLWAHLVLVIAIWSWLKSGGFCDRANCRKCHHFFSVSALNGSVSARGLQTEPPVDSTIVLSVVKHFGGVLTVLCAGIQSSLRREMAVHVRTVLYGSTSTSTSRGDYSG